MHSLVFKSAYFQVHLGGGKKISTREAKERECPPEFHFRPILHTRIFVTLYINVLKNQPKIYFGPSVIADILYVMVGQELWNPQAGSGMAKNIVAIFSVFSFLSVCAIIKPSGGVCNADTVFW